MATPTTIQVGTRSSKLAMVQARAVVAALEAANPGVTFVIDARETAGDRDKVTPLPALGKGLWTSEFEARLVAGGLDIVVHSAKDMPTSLPDGCILGATLEREDARDAIIFAPGAPYKTLDDLAPGSVVGTSSVRRSAQLKRRYANLVFKDLRGNIDTRLRKLDAPEEGATKYDCIILAAAGLKRMHFDDRISQLLDHASSGTLHAVGQGALGIEVRAGDEAVLAMLSKITHAPTMLACLAERAVMRALEGGCSVPIGVESSFGGADNNELRLRATVVSLDGKTAMDADETRTVTTAAEAEALGLNVARTMVAQGAQAILDAINKNRVTPPAVSVASS